ncbi:MAG TPA: hypothetical protein VHF69_09075 [Candidatus Synoicihabitans sp.]|nr:hypothetical protein [Candidatus Synoicihabitans sp.]
MDTYRIVSVTISFTIKRPLVQLEEQVNLAMREGWRPTGGPLAHGSTLLQAMVRDR